MTTYVPPLRDMGFVLKELGLLDALKDVPGFEEVNAELVDAVLGEAGKLASEVLAPLNAPGDRQRATLENGVVHLPDRFADAYRAFVDGGWAGIPFDPDYGGQGLPWLVSAAAFETWIAANTAWSLGPILTIAAVELLVAHGSAEQKATYLPKLVAGEWAGTMNLTEPQAGSDLGALRCRAAREGDHYRVTGQKIFITYGEHEMTPNIVHMVLARTPNAPAGPKGISLFIVPKFLVGPDGAPGPRNDLRCVSLEHKLGIHASPTCVMSFGDNGGAVGYLVGAENEGLAQMFTMMNNARMNIGVSGLAIAERAYQQAVAYARQRVQSGPIIRHPDIRRMLMTMKALIEAMRIFAYDASLGLDLAKRHPDREARTRAQARVDLLTPVVKAWCTDNGVDIASLAIQVHGGMGYIEETGAAQHYRDARIAPIYEGTNGIQAMDLVRRKLLRDEGDAAHRYIEELRGYAAAAAAQPLGPAADLPKQLATGIDALASATDWLLAEGKKDVPRALAGATPYLKLFGTVAGGAMLARAAIAVSGDRAISDESFAMGKLKTAAFYANNILPHASALATSVMEGGNSVLTLEEDVL